MILQTSINHPDQGEGINVSGEASGRVGYAGNSGYIQLARIGHTASVNCYHGYFYATNKFNHRQTIIQVTYGGATNTVVHNTGAVGGANCDAVYTNGTYSVQCRASTTSSNYNGTMHYHIWGSGSEAMIAVAGY
tara:strand:- start:100 stop:501 length:402 start_codon:yes stop_codon:yes gene_type:complete